MAPPAKPLSKEELTTKVKEFTLIYGACVVGITTRETLAGGPPSTDLSYVLEGARSAVTFGVPLNQDKILDFLGKVDREGHQKDYCLAATIATGIAAEMANFVRQFGHETVAVLANQVYRNDAPGMRRQPDLSHRYLAVRGGIGWFGFSGNVLTPSHGPNVQFATMVTDAELEPTDPLPEQDNYCDDCQACNASCPSGFFRNGKTDKVTITMGGVDFTYSQRRSYDRCSYVCGGKTGLHQSGRWSTWSPARFPIPKQDEDVLHVLTEGELAWRERPELPGGGLQSPKQYSLTKRDIPLTCGNCALVCHPDREERDRRLKLLHSSGVVIQHEDGSVEAVSPKKAKAHIAAMAPERRALYETPNPEKYDPKKYWGHKHHSQYSLAKTNGKKG